jgi:hypothetical protein
MSQELTKVSKAEEIAEEAIRMFDLVSREVNTPSQLAESTGLSLKTVYNRINQGRDIINDEIRKHGPKYFADVWRKYEYIWEQANIEWVATKNPKFLPEMRSVLEAFRKMQALDAAPKAPVGEDGKAMPQAMIMVFDETAYKVKELESKMAETVEGTFTESATENSTEVPLTPDENVVK